MHPFNVIHLLIAYLLITSISGNYFETRYSIMCVRRLSNLRPLEIGETPVQQIVANCNIFYEFRGNCDFGDISV